MVASATQLVEKGVIVATTLLLKYHESNWWVQIMGPGIVFSAVASVASFLVFDSPQFHHDR